MPIYLQAAHQKQTNKEIAAGLKKGGIATTSENFEATVATALLRLKNEGVVLRFSDGWDLAASYPDSLKNRLEKDAKPSKRRGKAKGVVKARKRTVEARTRSKPKAVQRPANEAAIGLSDRIAAYLQTRGEHFTLDTELASELGANLQIVRMTLGKMFKAEKIERLGQQRVRLVRRIA